MDNKSSRPPKTFKPSIAFSNPKKISAVKSFQCFPSSYAAPGLKKGVHFLKKEKFDRLALEF
jgi:hypothetical protein